MRRKTLWPVRCACTCLHEGQGKACATYRREVRRHADKGCEIDQEAAIVRLGRVKCKWKVTSERTGVWNV